MAAGRLPMIESISSAGDVVRPRTVCVRCWIVTGRSFTPLRFDGRVPKKQRRLSPLPYSSFLSGMLADCAKRPCSLAGCSVLRVLLRVRLEKNLALPASGFGFEGG